MKKASRDSAKRTDSMGSILLTSLILVLSILIAAVFLKEQPWAEVEISNEDILTLLATLLSVLMSFVLVVIKDKVDTQMITKESAEIDKKIQLIFENKKENMNVIDLMLKNVSELREYYIISKNQATRTFSSALAACFLGAGIYILGIVAYVFWDKDMSIISIVGGTVVELVSGLFFWLYKEATKQLSIYHQRLGMTEKYLTVIKIVKEMDGNDRAVAYQTLIESILADNKEIIKKEK